METIYNKLININETENNKNNLYCIYKPYKCIAILSRLKFNLTFSEKKAKEHTQKSQLKIFLGSFSLTNEKYFKPH